MAMDILILRTILLCTLTTKTVLLQTSKNISHQLQEMQTTCQAQTPPIIRLPKASSMTSSGISNFQKIRQNFWRQGYNCGIYYTTPWKWQHFKDANFTELVQDLMDPYEQMGCNMSLKMHFYFYTWISFHWIVVSWASNMGSASIKTFRWWSTGTKGNVAPSCLELIAGWWKRDTPETKYHRQAKRTRR